MPKQRNILLALGYNDHRFHLGVARFAREHGWHLASDMAYGRSIPWGWTGDGVISKIANDAELLRFVHRLRVPVINVGRLSGYDLPVVLTDEPALVALAVEHFISRGFRNFSWCGTFSPRQPANRGTLFVDTLRGAGQTCGILNWQSACRVKRENWAAHRKWLISQLKTLVLPHAIFCWDDSEAANLIEACHAAHLGIPEDVAVLGVNNDELVCETLRVPLSSIDTDMEGRAYRAAELLERRMSGKTVPRITLMPPRCVVTRKSSDVLAIAHTDVAAALRFIWDNSDRPISIRQVAEAVALSPRGLHKAFVKNLGRSPVKELLRVRLLRAQQMLRDSDAKIADIAARTGYGSTKNMFRAFSHELKMTPKEYRAEQRVGRTTLL